jgi:tetratricopeptide (TPR) repeat protein
VWANRITLWQDCVKKYNDNARGHVNLGNAFKVEGRLDSAIKHYLKAIRIEPGLAQAHYNLGIAYGMKGMYNLAYKEISIAKRLTQGKWEKWFQKGTKPQMKPFPGHP